MKEKGWKDGAYDFDFEDAWDCALNIDFEYKGREYVISLEEGERAYDYETREVIRYYESKEDFYSSTLFGLPVKEVIDNSVIISIG